MTKAASRSLCVLPWIQQSLYPNADVYPCCLMVNKYKLGTFPSIDKEKLDSLKKDILEGPLPEACRECANAECAGVKSYRQSANEAYPAAYKELVETGDTKPLRLEIRLSNLCNFACRTCNAGNSTGWYQDAKFLGNKEKLNELNFVRSAKAGAFEELVAQANKVKELHFMGGEPLLHPEHFKLLESLKDKNQKSIFYVTNLSHISDDKEYIKKTWGDFRHVFWDVSLDGVGAKGEIIRKGLNWKVFEKNLNKLQSYTSEFPFTIGVSITLSALNYCHLSEVIKYCLDSQLKRLNFNFVTTPAHYQVQALGSEQKLLARQRILELIEQEGLDGQLAEDLRAIIRFAETSPADGLYKNFTKITDIMDNLRSEKSEILFK